MAVNAVALPRLGNKEQKEPWKNTLSLFPHNAEYILFWK